MADRSSIEWTDATWNPITGCSVISPGCKHCYAMLLAGTRMIAHPSRAGLTIDTKAGPVWTGEVRFNEGWLDQPLHWKRPRAVFVCAHSDLFHDAIPFEWIDRIFAVMAGAPQHRFQILTKRPERMRQYAELANRWGRRWLAQLTRFGAPTWPLSNVWLGTSVEDTKRLDRIDALRATPAALRWVSAEPLLGSLKGIDLRGIGWVVSGGESGPRARPSHPDWHRELRDACAKAGVAYHFKQWGEYLPESQMDADGFLWVAGREKTVHWWLPDTPQAAHSCSIRVGKRQAGRRLDGAYYDGMPA